MTPFKDPKVNREYMKPYMQKRRAEQKRVAEEKQKQTQHEAEK